MAFMATNHKQIIYSSAKVDKIIQLMINNKY